MIVSLRVKKSNILEKASSTEVLNSFEAVNDVSWYLVAQMMTNHYRLPKMAYMLAQAVFFPQLKHPTSDVGDRNKKKGRVGLPSPLETGQMTQRIDRRQNLLFWQ